MGVGALSIFVCSMLLAQAGDPPAPPTQDAPSDAAGPLVPYPHPLITEVLFAVPTSGGDANKDGTRHPTGDEFIELTNPHGQPINLAGYRLTDRHRGEKGRFSFTFPNLILQPGQTAVVFNGLDATWTGPVGDTHRAPPGPNPLFEGAFVFTAGVSSRYLALANEADLVLLENALHVPVHVVVWGNPDQAPPADAHHTDTISSIPRASVQRTSASGAMVAHDRIDGQTCSPGVAYPQAPSTATPTGTQQPAGPEGSP
jgi:hypothetical protein